MVIIDVCPEKYFSAARHMQVNKCDFVDYFAGLKNDLRAHNTLTGQHTTGQQFARQYCSHAQNLSELIAELINESATKIDIFNTCAVMYYNVEHLQADKDFEKKPYPPLETRVSENINLPEITGGSGKLPSWWSQISAQIDDHWPDPDLDALHTMQLSWHNFSRKLDSLTTSLNRVQKILAELTCPAREKHEKNIAQYYAKLTKTARECGYLAQDCQQYEQMYLDTIGNIDIIINNTSILSDTMMLQIKSAIAQLDQDNLTLIAQMQQRFNTIELIASTAEVIHCEEQAVTAIQNPEITNIAIAKEIDDENLAHMETIVDTQLDHIPCLEQIKKGYSPWAGLTQEDFYRLYGTGKNLDNYPHIIWPPHDGFQDTPQRSDHIPQGTQLDHIGPEYKGFMANASVPLAQRSIHPDQLIDPAHGFMRHFYIGTGRKLPDNMYVESGPAAPAFGQPGGGMQWIVKKIDPDGQRKKVSITELLALGIIIRDKEE